MTNNYRVSNAGSDVPVLVMRTKKELANKNKTSTIISLIIKRRRCDFLMRLP